MLGIKWLASLNTVQANWNKMFMIFWLNGKKYKLQGLTTNSDTFVHLHSMLITQELVEADVFGLLNVDRIFDESTNVLSEPMICRNLVITGMLCHCFQMLGHLIYVLIDILIT